MKGFWKEWSAAVGLLVVSASAVGAQSKPVETPKEKAGSPAKSVLQEGAGTKPVAAVPTIDELIKQASALADAGKYDEAINLFNQVVQRDRKNIQGFVGLGFCYLQSKRYPQAITSYQTAVNLNPTFAEYHFLLASALTAAEKYREGHAEAERAIDLDPSELRYRLGLADSYRRERDYAKARELYLLALGYGPDSAEVHNGLGELNLQDKRFEDALAEFDASLRIKAEDVEAQLGKSGALSGLKRHIEAAQVAQNVIKKFPQQSFGYSALAAAQDAADRHDEAIATYQQALKITPQDATMWGNMGWSQYNAGKFQDALVSSRKALEIDPSLAYVRLNIGLVFAVLDDWKQSSAEYQKAVEVSTLSDITAGIGDVQDALKKSNRRALHQALAYLQSSERQATGFTK